MPVAPPASQHLSLFSSIRRAIHASSHHNPSAVAPDPPTPPSQSLSSLSSSSSSSSSSSHDPHRLQLYDAFESKVVRRLSSLSPMEDAACVNLASLKQFLQVLLEIQDDVISLVPSHQYPPSQAQTRMMEEFLERSVKLLDVCRVIKEQILDVESSQGMLYLVLSCLSPKNGGVLQAGQVARARKALGEILLLMEGDEEVTPPVHLYRSFRFRCNDSCPDAPQRWRSWHGNTRSSVQTNMPTLDPSRQLQAIGSVLTVPRPAAGDVEENLCAAIYTLNVLSIFFLGTLSASLPSHSKTYVGSFAHPRIFSWAPPLSHLQEKVQEELKWRGKKSNRYVGMWELDQIATIVKRLFELTEGEDFSLGDKAREEIKNLVKQLRQHVEEVDRDLGLLYTQLMDFYGRIITSRMEILDVLSKF